MTEQIPWSINTIGSLYHPDCSSEIQVERQGTIYTVYVAAVCIPCPPSIKERFRAAWWVFTGRAHAFIWPEPGDLEAIWSRDKPTLRPTPRPVKIWVGTWAPLTEALFDRLVQA